MNLRKGLSAFLIFVLTFYSFCFSQQKESVRVPDVIAEIVKEFSADTLVSSDEALSVLNFLENVYSEHGYYDSGSWPGHEGYITYRPYQGALPSYEIKDFKKPAPGEKTSGYGYRPQFRRFHHGIDIGIGLGDTIKCVLPGIVTLTGFDKYGYGNYVVVSHSGGLETLYAHLSTCLVNPGEMIESGGALGLGGVTGNATGPHLHFETRYRGIAVDPSNWFDATLFR